MSKPSKQGSQQQQQRKEREEAQLQASQAKKQLKKQSKGNVWTERKWIGLRLRLLHLHRLRHPRLQLQSRVRPRARLQRPHPACASVRRPRSLGEVCQVRTSSSEVVPRRAPKSRPPPGAGPVQLQRRFRAVFGDQEEPRDQQRQLRGHPPVRLQPRARLQRPRPRSLGARVRARLRSEPS